MWHDKFDIQLSELQKVWQIHVSGGITDDLDLSDFMEMDHRLRVAEYPGDADILESVFSRKNNDSANDEEEKSKNKNSKMCRQKGIHC